MEITGATRVFGVVADPIVHVRAPEVLNPLFARAGADRVLVPIHVTAGGLEALVRGLRHWRNLDGFCVTLPHKERMLELADEAGEQARLIGAANVARLEADGRLVVENFDGLGFVAGIRAEGHEPGGRRVLLVGAGGAAMALAFALADAGVKAVVIANRTAAKAQALAARVKAAYPGVAVSEGAADPAGFDLVINATSLGLRADDPLPFDIEACDEGTLVAEIIMKPERTPLVEAAEARGLPVHPGRHMFDHQARLLAEFLGALPART